MKRTSILLALPLLFCAASIASGTGDPSPNEVVLSWRDESSSPKATIEDIRWLEGEWEGALDSAMQQHVAFAPVSGHMPGFARAWGSDGAIWFYEINDFVEVGGSLEFRVKHFSASLEGWEDKDGFARHRLIKMGGNSFQFDGITFVKDGPDRHTVYVRIADGERKGEIVVVHQKRVRH